MQQLHYYSQNWSFYNRRTCYKTQSLVMLLWLSTQIQNVHSWPRSAFNTPINSLQLTKMKMYIPKCHCNKISVILLKLQQPPPPHTTFCFYWFNFHLIQIALTIFFLFFAIKSLSITNRSVSQEYAFKKSSTLLVFSHKTIRSSSSLI